MEQTHKEDVRLPEDLADVAAQVVTAFESKDCTLGSDFSLEALVDDTAQQMEAWWDVEIAEAELENNEVQQVGLTVDCRVAFNDEEVLPGKSAEGDKGAAHADSEEKGNVVFPVSPLTGPLAQLPAPSAADPADPMEAGGIPADNVDASQPPSSEDEYEGKVHSWLCLGWQNKQPVRMIPPSLYSL
jgi:hypothetical protein